MSKIHEPHGLLGFTDQGLPVAEFGGEPRVLASLPPRPVSPFPDWNSPQAQRAVVKAKRKFLPQDQWQEQEWSDLVDEILNQGRSSACTGFSTCGSFTVGHIVNNRSQQRRRFDPYFPYGLCNGGRDQGAVVGDLLKEMKDTGICEHGILPPGAMFRQQFPQEAFDNAKRFRVAKAFTCQTFEDCCSAISCGWQVVFGILVGRNFGDLSSEGVAPPPDVILGGHALGGVGLRRLRSQWGIRTLNSWGAQWGDKGFCVLTKQSFDARVDAFAIQVATWDPEEKGPPVVSGGKTARGKGRKGAP